MTYTILLELHDGILDGSKESDQVIGELARKKVDQLKWEMEQAKKTRWLGWQELNGKFTAVPWSEDNYWLMINLYEAQKIKEYAGEFEAVSKEAAIQKTAQILTL